MGKKSDLLGKRFGRLEVIEENPIRSKDGQVRWGCICDCGNFTVVLSKLLKLGKTKSCGCYQKEQSAERSSTHGKSKTKVYNAWQNIKERCHNPDNPSYPVYGGAGIVLPESFINDFMAFYVEVGNPPDETRDWSIDRIDYTKNYEPGNLRWATSRQQAQNKGKLSSNTSGHTGVGFMDNGKNQYWVAHWHSLDGRQMSKCFSIKKLGYNRAMELAIIARKEAIDALNKQGADYSINHGLC